jgi:hypothetical protein
VEREGEERERLFLNGRGKRGGEEMINGQIHPSILNFREKKKRASLPQNYNLIKKKEKGKKRKGKRKKC